MERVVQYDGNRLGGLRDDRIGPDGLLFCGRGGLQYGRDMRRLRGCWPCDGVVLSI
jgi:hypothetical protein